MLSPALCGFASRRETVHHWPRSRLCPLGWQVWRGWWSSWRDAGTKTPKKGPLPLVRKLLYLKVPYSTVFHQYSIALRYIQNMSLKCLAPNTKQIIAALPIIPSVSALFQKCWFSVCYFRAPPHAPLREIWFKRTQWCSRRRFRW